MKPSISGLQKLGIVIVLVLLVAYTGLSLVGIQETRDAETVEAVQVSLQTSLSKGVAMLQLPPPQIHPLNIINAARSTFPKGAHVDKNMTLTLDHSSRGAQYKVTPEGDMVITSLINFTRFHVENGRIVRNNHWLPNFNAELPAIPGQPDPMPETGG